MASGSLMSSRSGGLTANPFQFLQREMNRLFDDVFHSDFAIPMAGGGNGDAALLMPRVEIRETDKELRVIAELPGVTEKDIEVALDDDMLTIRGEKKTERTEEHENTHFTERAFGTFQRSLRLPYRVEPNQVKASFENGVLTVTMPKNKAQEQARKIPVQVGSSEEELGPAVDSADRRGGHVRPSTAFGCAIRNGRGWPVPAFNASPAMTMERRTRHEHDGIPARCRKLRRGACE